MPNHTYRIAYSQPDGTRTFYGEMFLREAHAVARARVLDLADADVVSLPIAEDTVVIVEEQA